MQPRVSRVERFGHPPGRVSRRQADPAHRGSEAPRSGTAPPSDQSARTGRPLPSTCLSPSFVRKPHGEHGAQQDAQGTTNGTAVPLPRPRPACLSEARTGPPTKLGDRTARRESDAPPQTCRRASAVCPNAPAARKQGSTRAERRNRPATLAPAPARSAGRAICPNATRVPRQETMRTEPKERDAINALSPDGPPDVGHLSERREGAEAEIGPSRTQGPGRHQRPPPDGPPEGPFVRRPQGRSSRRRCEPNPRTGTPPHPGRLSERPRVARTRCRCDWSAGSTGSPLVHAPGQPPPGGSGPVGARFHPPRAPSRPAEIVRGVRRRGPAHRGRDGRHHGFRGDAFPLVLTHPA